MLNHQKIRQWLKAKGEPALILKHRWPVENREGQNVPSVELRLMLLMGEMDYTLAVHAPQEEYDADPSVRKRLTDRIAWESHRDTLRTVDIERALEAGERYQKENE